MSRATQWDKLFVSSFLDRLIIERCVGSTLQVATAKDFNKTEGNEDEAKTNNGGRTEVHERGRPCCSLGDERRFMNDGRKVLARWVVKKAKKKVVGSSKKQKRKGR